MSRRRFQEYIDVFATCIWDAEFNNATSSDKHEYYFTLGEIADAKAGSLPNRWIVRYADDVDVEIQVN
jgi:hypothetical protein